VTGPRAAWRAIVARWFVTSVALSGAAGVAHAQPYARWATPDSLLAPALRSSGGGYERTWNTLLVAELRASLARADSATRLATLAARVAAAEPAVFGTHIAPDAWRLRGTWRVAERRGRVAAAVAESLAQAAQTGGHWPRADSLFHVALTGYRQVRETRRAAWVLGSLAVVSTNAGWLDRADSLDRAALVARRGIGDSVMTGNSLHDLGVIAQRAGRPHDALAWFGEAVRVRTGTGETAKRGSSLRGVADAWRALGATDSALALYPVALELASAGGDSARVSEIASGHADLLLESGRPLEAVAALERSRVIAEQRGDLSYEAIVLADQASALRAAGDFTDGIAKLEHARELALAAGDPVTLQKTLLDLGRMWLNVQDPAAARAPLERALVLADSLGDPHRISQAYTDLALVRQQEGDPRAAERLAARALHAADETGDSARVHEVAVAAGLVALEQGRLADARALYTRAANAMPDAGLEDRAVDQLNLGSVASLEGRYEDAQSALGRAAALADSGGLAEIRWRVWCDLGDVAERRGATSEALAWDRRAASLIDTLRVRQQGEGASVQLFARRLFAYEALIHLLGKLDPQYPDSGFAAEAFAWSERARARSFLDVMAGGSEHAVTLTLAEAQRHVPEKTALLVYSVGDSSTALWIVTARKWRHVMLPPRRAIQTRVELLRRALGDPASSDQPATLAAAYDLYRTVIAPVERDLKSVDRLILAPDGPLALVPFEALLTRQPRADGTAPKGSWVVERWPVSYVPSASVLAALGSAAVRKAVADSGIVALGDPDFGIAQTGRVSSDVPPPGMPAAGTLPRLPNTAAEIVALTSLAGPRPVRVLTGSHAMRDTLMSLAELSRAELLHIATHGIANESDPSRSGLWMAAADSAAWPGFLSVGDIRGLKLSAALVTLSACETGLGRLERGEGVIGLTRAFLGAGAGSVVVSLWSVNDVSTAMLMNAFYRELLANGATRDVALAHAKRALLARPETRSPFHWAPFVLVGGSGPLN
jgi:CHAT domain-containing protein/tetratricopeptide (TPR) repeat protein